MSFTRTLVIASCCLAFAGAACGGDSSDGVAPDSRSIPTATMPAELPTAVIVVGGVAKPGGGSTYTIKSGDTLADIAERFGVSLEDLLAANPGIDPSLLHTGDSVKLPSGTNATPGVSATETPADPDTTPEPEPTSKPAPTEEPSPDPTNTPAAGAQTYAVESGDFPGTIAEKFGITVEELLAANPGIDPTNLQIGQVLNIPAPSGG